MTGSTLLHTSAPGTLVFVLAGLFALAGLFIIVLFAYLLVRLTGGCRNLDEDDDIGKREQQHGDTQDEGKVGSWKTRLGQCGSLWKQKRRAEVKVLADGRAMERVSI